MLNVKIAPHREFLPADASEQKMFLMLKLRPTQEVATSRPPTTFAFVIDTSGSMYEEVTGGKSKLDIVIESLQALVKSGRLAQSDRVSIIQFDDSELRSTPAPPPPDPTPETPPPSFVGSTARFVSKQPGSPVPEFTLDSSAIIGRFDSDTGPVDVDLEGFPGEDTISRNHAEIYQEAGVWKIKDLGSTNGVFIKPAGQTRYNARITTPEVLNPGDEVAMAKIRFLFESP